ncbi:trigger factor [Pelomicrobium sp.]|jgi:trigger factor|uniref:trigger factor n=1 Tax=Pelomicrobium sp. TaxID=2815319 RepID=UPI002FDDF171
MQIQLENLGALKRRLDVTLPRSQIEAEVESRLKRIARTAKMHGFRPGKIPLKVIAQTYGAQVRQEVLGDAVQKSFAEAVRSRNLRVAGFPQFEPQPSPESDADFHYSAVFEVYPEVQLGDLSSVTIERPVHEVTEADVDHTIEVLRKQRTSFVPVARGAAQGDRLTLDFQGTLDGQPFEGGQGQGVTVILGEGRLLPAFEEKLLSMKAGQTQRFEVEFPEDARWKEVAGKTVTFEVSVHAVEEPRLPPLDADFAKALGVADGDLDKMRSEIRANVEREVKQRLQARLKERVMEALLAAASLELPQALVQAEQHRLAEAARRDLEGRGVRVQGAPLPLEMFAEQAERRVKLGLILAELVKRHGLHARPEQVRAIVEDFAQSYERPEEVVKWYYSKPERLNDAEALALEENVVRWVLAQAKVVDQPVSFDELTGK